MPLTGFVELTTHPQHVYERSMAVLDMLSGVSSPITSRRLETDLDLSGTQIRAVVHALRMAGHPVCSTSKGYYLAYTLADLDVTIAHLHERSRSIKECAHALERCRGAMAEAKEGRQLELDAA